MLRQFSTVYKFIMRLFTTKLKLQFLYREITEILFVVNKDCSF